ncbi:cation transporter [Marinicella gelatinilytica]|uniref:cation transporter n=1 Tax=Marinicella gelatinilytica TaxID=2996017 RepID=UPI002260F2C8|nr:cation transporter [Marinicella gelatinilytica]MCX7546243.1 cation transporter [Marinicella gelatinilytica]
MSDSCGNSCNNTAQSTDQVTKVPDHGLVSTFEVTKMDCPSEESMIRMALENCQSLKAMDFDIPGRRLKVYHENGIEEIQQKLTNLNLGASLLETQQIDSEALSVIISNAKSENSQEFRVLIWLLIINAVMFVVEFAIGILAQSTGLIADSLDMFADAAVYGTAIYAVGKSNQLKLKAAHLSGWVQVLLGTGALIEVIRRFIYGSEPVSTLMIVMGLVALVANVTCLLLIAKKKDSGAHMKASWIFSANDVIANTGVILAGVLVMLTGSALPDLVIGLVIAMVVLNGARRILQIKS